jgi:hypothetical protein
VKFESNGTERERKLRPNSCLDLIFRGRQDSHHKRKGERTSMGRADMGLQTLRQWTALTISVLRNQQRIGATDGWFIAEKSRQQKY